MNAAINASSAIHILKTRIEMGSINTLCASWLYYIPDAAVLLILLIVTLNCGKKGFVNCIFGVVSNLVAFILAIVLCNVVLEATGGIFGLQDWYAEKLTEVFSGIAGFDGDISASGVQTALETQNVPAVVARLVLKMTDGGDVPTGTTLAMLLGDAVASLAGMLTCVVLLYIVIKLLVSILKKILNGVVNKLVLLRGVNTLLGSAFGLLYAFLCVSGILAILTILPVTGVAEFFSNTLLLNSLYTHNPLVYLLSVFL